jgi:DUF1365 family protein
MGNASTLPHPFSSGLYEVRVLHERHGATRRRFSYRLFYFALLLDEVPALASRLSLFSVDRFNLFSFSERDHLNAGSGPHNPSDGHPALAAGHGLTLTQRVSAFCASHGVDLGEAPRILLVTLPRVLGHRFNPVSFFFCADREGRPLGAIAEVGNTFGESKPYFVPVDPARPGRFLVRCPKHFYVSPFLAPSLDFEFDLRLPGSSLALRVDTLGEGRLALHSTLTGAFAALGDARLLWLSLRHPLVGLVVLMRIHLQAFRLWRLRVPFFRKSEAAADQRDLYHPHSSLQPTKAP